MSGKFAGIQISASDGTRSASLPAFAIAVSAPAAGASSVNLTWQAPTENSDGSPLTDLKGYKIHYGTQSQNYTGAISVDNPTLTTYLVASLPAGKYYFAVTAFNAQGPRAPLGRDFSDVQLIGSARRAGRRAHARRPRSAGADVDSQIGVCAAFRARGNVLGRLGRTLGTPGFVRSGCPSKLRRVDAVLFQQIVECGTSDAEQFGGA